jgi:hypothetical protein
MTPRDGHDGPEQDDRPAPILITDKRHSRALDEAADEVAAAPAPPAAPAPVAPPTPPEGVVEFTRPAASVPPAVAPVVPEPPAPAPEQVELDEEAYAAAEMEHLRLLFGAGLITYLRSQLGLLLNFALIGLGRAPNPATGLVSTELDKAKLAIDVLEFTALRLKGQLPANEEQELAQILAELKYTFLQLASSAPVPPSGGGEA